MLKLAQSWRWSRNVAVAAALVAAVSAPGAESLLSVPPGLPSGGVGKGEQDLDGGVVVNQTITVAGQNFFRYFVSSWRDREMSERYAVSVHERPSARWGSHVWIEYRQKRVFQAQLPSSIAGIKALSEQAVDVAYQRLVDVEVERLLVRDADVGSDEL